MEALAGIGIISIILLLIIVVSVFIFNIIFGEILTIVWSIYEDDSNENLNKNLDKLWKLKKSSFVSKVFHPLIGIITNFITSHIRIN
jgi:hypothetical protein